MIQGTFRFEYICSNCGQSHIIGSVDSKEKFTCFLCDKKKLGLDKMKPPYPRDFQGAKEEYEVRNEEHLNTLTEDCIYGSFDIST